MTCPSTPDTVTSARVPPVHPSDIPPEPTISSTTIPANALTPRTTPSAVTITITATPPPAGETQETQPANPNPNPKPKHQPPTYLQRVAKQLNAKRRRASNDNDNSDSTLAQCVRFFIRYFTRDLAWRVLAAAANVAWWYLRLIRLVFVARPRLPPRREGVHRVVWRALVQRGEPECWWLARLVVVSGLGMVLALGAAPLVWWVVRVAAGGWGEVVGVLVGAVWEGE
jgi:hypothetical protein